MANPAVNRFHRRLQNEPDLFKTPGSS